MEQRNDSMFVSYKCMECGFNGEVITEEKKVKCPKCGAVNDVWLKGETPPPNHAEQRNEAEFEPCRKCGKQILKGAYLCDAYAHVIDCKQLDEMERNEPSTAEIVRELRKMQNAAQVVLDSGFGTREGENNMLYIKRKAMAKNAADRLESQERENAEKDVQIAALTARAESAERERDAAVNALTLYEDALFDECDKSYQSGFMDGFRSREEIDDED